MQLVELDLAERLLILTEPLVATLRLLLAGQHIPLEEAELEELPQLIPVELVGPHQMVTLIIQVVREAMEQLRLGLVVAVELPEPQEQGMPVLFQLLV